MSYMKLETKSATGAEIKTVAELAAETKAAFNKAHDQVKGIAEEALGKAKAGEALAEGLKIKADEALVGLNGLKAQLAEIEQKMARSGGSDVGEALSFGERFVRADSVKGVELGRGSVTVEMKASLTTATSGEGAVGGAIAQNHLQGVQMMATRKLTIRDLLMPGRTDSGLIKFTKETGFANAAAAKAEGAAAAQSSITLTPVEVTTKVIAHFITASQEALSDVSQLRSMIDTRLTAGLRLKEEAAILFGDGTGANMLGIVPQATAYAAPLALVGETSIDKVRLMMLQAALAEYPATAVVMNPIDWTWIDTLKDSTGRYIIGNPQGSLAPTLWGLPVVATTAMAVDKCLVGAFDMAAQVFDQWQVSVTAGFINDQFVRGETAVLATERLALAVYRPEAFIYGDFGRVA